MLEFISAYILGILSILSPCTLIIIPLLTAKADTKLKEILKFLAGLVITFTILGALSALAGKLLTNFMGPYLYLFAAIITFVSGLDLLNLIKLKIPHIFSPVQPQNNFFFGLIYGGVALSCLGPLLSIVLVYVVSKANIFSGMVMMLLYSLGFVTPLMLFGLLINDKSVAKRLMKHTLTIRKVGGIVLLLVSGYLFYLASRGF